MADQAQRLKTIADGVEATWQALRRAAANISGLLSIGRATCDEVKAYNLWALAIYNTQRGMLATLRANGEQGVPELPMAPTLFTWKGMSGADAWKIDCAGQPSSLGLGAQMKRALRGPATDSQYLSTNEISIVTTDQFAFQPEQSPSYAQMLALQQQRAQEDQGQHVNGLGVAWAVVILIAGIAVGVGVAIVAIMHYLETSEVQEANIKQTQAQADAFANYTAARLACFQQCTGSGKSTEECVEHCKKLVDKPNILLPGFTSKWGLLQWIGFTVAAGLGTMAAVKLFQRHRAGKPLFELPELSGAADSYEDDEDEGELELPKQKMAAKPPKRASSSTSTEVRSPTSTATEVRSPTSTSTEVRSPTSTSTDAYTSGNVTVTGGAGAGATTSVKIVTPRASKETRRVDSRAHGHRSRGSQSRMTNMIKATMAPRAPAPMPAIMKATGDRKRRAVSLKR